MTRLKQAQPESRSETFCTYLAKQFIAKKGFELARVPEVQRLQDACEIVLTRSGYSFDILCMVDREARPNAIFDIGAEELREIGRACLKYAGEVNRRKMPVSIGVLEVGPRSPEQEPRLLHLKRTSLLAKVLPFAMIVDTVACEVWDNTTNWLSKGLYESFIEKLLVAPRESEANLAPTVVATAPPSFPILAPAILLALSAVFAAEIAFGIGPWTKLLQPTITTLVALGGVSGSLVLQSSEWYRLFSAPFLHVDAGHLAMNAIGLFLAGRALESLIGRAWFGALYVVGALGGTLLSVLLNPPSIISVGASGAIMGLFAAMLVLSMHFPPGPIRTRLQMDAFYVLLPSLLPLASALQGHKVDYAAHFGGAIGGAIVGVVLLGSWSRNEALPGLRQIAGAIGIAGVIALAYPALSVLRGYQGMAFASQLIPSDKFPKTSADMRARAAELIAQYPHDPRPRFSRAADLLDSNDPVGAEREARAGLAEEDAWRSLLSEHVGTGLRVMLAIAIYRDRPEAARSTARTACATLKDGPLRKLLDERKLCGT